MIKFNFLSTTVRSDAILRDLLRACVTASHGHFATRYGTQCFEKGGMHFWLAFFSICHGLLLIGCCCYGLEVSTEDMSEKPSDFGIDYVADAIYELETPALVYKFGDSLSLWRPKIPTVEEYLNADEFIRKSYPSHVFAAIAAGTQFQVVRIKKKVR